MGGYSEALGDERIQGAMALMALIALMVACLAIFLTGRIFALS